MKPRSFKFHATDFLVGTATMTAEEVGAYIRLLCHQWDKGSVPAEDEALCRLAGCRNKVIAAVRAKFATAESGLVNECLDQQRRFIASCSNSGRKGGGNPNFQRGKPNPYSQFSGDNHKGIDKGTNKGRHKGRDKGTHKGISPTPGDEELFPERPRNDLFDALCRAEGSNPDEIGAQGARIGKCLKQIRQSSPEVTPGEIERRAANYPTHFDGAALTADALAKWWARCGERAHVNGNGERAYVSAAPANLR